jgi:ADP-ribosylglycohydrolase
MKEILLWTVAAAFAAGFLAANYSNVQLLRGKYARPDGSNPSPVLFVGGILGVLACLAAPDETLRTYFWVPLLLDLGTGPYVLVAAIAFAAAALSASKTDAASGAAPARAVSPAERSIVGCIFGTAVGDAFGLACEGLSRNRQAKMFPGLAGYKLLPFGKGMCSDDTEHTCMLAQSLIETARYPDIDEQAKKFAANFGWRLRFWLLGMPAGIGFATLRAIVKLWIGFPARTSGVFSAGNGPAMRVALIGVCYGGDPERMRALVRAATRITHTDPKAEHGALAVALAAHLASTGQDIAPEDYARRLRELLGDGGRELLELVDSVAQSVSRKETAADYTARTGCGNGISGYMLHSVPAALHVWLAHQGDYRGGVTTVVRLGGDTDTVAAMVGAIIGARVGKEGIPADWLRDLWEWPRTQAWMDSVGIKLADRSTKRTKGYAVPLNWFKLLLRNAFFMPLVLAHGFRRLLPPY